MRTTITKTTDSTEREIKCTKTKPKGSGPKKAYVQACNESSVLEGKKISGEIRRKLGS